MVRNFQGEFCFANSGGSNNGDEFFHGVNFLIFFELNLGNFKFTIFDLKKLKSGKLVLSQIK